MKKSEEVKVIHDCIYGVIKLPQYIQAIIDTPQFQRLRWICQMGLTYFVYPSATHSRFEHSIGTYFVASSLVNKIKDQLDSVEKFPKLSETDVICVEIAALCHDIGHGPYSHWWDEIFSKKYCEKKFYKSHEQMSIEMFDFLIKSNSNTKDILHLWQIGQEEINFIKNLMNGDKSTAPKDRQFLYEIVSNKRSGLDVDKFDYLVRDMFYLGQSLTSYSVEILRFLHFYKVVQDSKGNWILAMKDEQFIQIHKIFYLRHVLQRSVCYHKTRKSIELMLCDAYIEAKKNFEISQMNNQTIKDTIQNRLFQFNKLCDIDLISKLTDQHFWHLIDMNSTNSNNSILSRILKRDLYVLHMVFLKKNFNYKMEDLIENKNKVLKDGKITPKIFDYKEWINYFLDNPTEMLIKSLNLEKFDCRSLRRDLIDHIIKELLNIVNLENKNLIRMSFTEYRIGSEETNPFHEIHFYGGKYENIFQFNDDSFPDALTTFKENEIEFQIFLTNNLILNNEINQNIKSWARLYNLKKIDHIEN